MSTSDDQFRWLLALALERLTEHERQRLAAALRAPTRTQRTVIYLKLLRRYHRDWYPHLEGRPAANAIESDLLRLERAGYMHKASPSFSDPKEAAAFDLLRAGPLLSAERIRKLL